MSMQKGKHPAGQTQGYSQRYPQHANYLSRPAATQRPEVSFHVAQPGFPGSQQGNGPNGHPGGPQGMSRQMHHPGHHGGPPGPGNPSLPPPGSAGGPGQQGGQVQQPPQSQGPQGPAPTSTPPGQDMGKQPPHMQQGQSQLPQALTFLNFPPPPISQTQNQDSEATTSSYQWGQIQLPYGMATAPRQPGSQNYYANARGPTPRMTNHRGPIVNMPTTHVSGQIYSQVPIQGGVIPQMYSGQVVPAQLQQQMFVHQQFPMFQSQPPRHQNHTSTGYIPAPAPQQILMTQQLYSGYQQHNPQQGHQYYYPTASPVGMPRPGSGVPGGPGPQMTQPQPQQVVQGGPQPQQIGQPGQVPMTMVQSGPPVGVPPTHRPDPILSSAQSSKARRKFALDIVDPRTGKNINDEIYEGSTTSSPPGSENSSARQTPQPNSGSTAMEVIADFAARVAKVASEDTNSHLQSFSETCPSPPSEQILNGPLESNITSIQDQPNSIPINVAVEENQWQTTQSKHTLKSDVVSEEEIVTKLDNVENNNVKLLTEVDVSFAKEFVPQMTPSVSLKDIPLVNSKILEPKDHVPDSQPIPVIINKEPQPVIETNSTPVVSANANTPSITLVHKSSNKDSFPVLKSTNNQPNQSLSQSPRRKPGSRETASAERTVVQNASFTPSTPVSTNPTPEAKIPKKEDFVVPQVPQPKERREKEKTKDKGGRGRREKSSQSRERTDKNRASTERIPSKSRERENERKNSLQSRERESEKSQQPREKRSQSREADKPATKKEVDAVKTPSPSPVSEPESLPQKPIPQLPTIAHPMSPAVSTEELQQPNGETSLDTSEGKGVKQHQQNAKGAKRNKMRSDQPTRKGNEKESVEEVVTSPPPPNVEEVVPVAGMPSVPTPIVSATPTPAPTVAPTQLPPAVDIPSAPTVSAQVTEEVDAERKEMEECDKIVLARNEENTKVSAAAAAKEDVPPLIENVTELKTIQVPPPKQLPYSDDQWSPLNPEGKKKYERDFLMELKEDPKSKKKPDNLPDLEVVLKDTSNRPRGGMMDGRSLVNRSHTDNFTPGFMRTGGGGQSNSRGLIPKRGSQQGKPSKGGKPAVITVSLSLREDVKLHETENAWKPSILKKPDVASDSKADDLYRKVRGVLNKLTPQKFDTLVSQVQNLPIDNSDRLQGVIDLVFEKAVDEPNFSVAYAQMCKVLSSMQVPAERKSADDPEFVNFRKLLVNRCQTEFEKNKEAELNREAKLEGINAQTDPEKKKELQLLFEDEERRIRMKSVGNIRFIGELFKLQMLTTSIMHRCIRHLLSQGDEESLEGLCKLLTTIGKDLESKVGGAGGNQNDLTPYFQKMKEIACKRGPNSVSSRVRFMLQDVIELRLGKWVPRRDDANPKTMDQIQKEAEKETMDMHLALSNAPNTPRRQDDRGGMGDRDRRGGKNQRGGDVGQQQDGWQSVPPRTNRNLVVDTSKIKVKQGEIENVSLGSGNQFSKWSRGSGSAVRVEEKKTSQPSYGNKYSVLGESANIADEKKGPPMPSQRPGPGKTTPSPSIENERMLSSFKTASDVSNRSSRSSSVQQSSRSSSRENSVRRNDFSRSQPGSVTASNEDISRTYPDKVSSSSSIKAQELSFDDINKKSHLLIEELLSNNLFSDCTENVLETFIPSQRHEFVRECLNAVLEKTSHSRLNVGQFLCHLIKNEVINLPQYLQGLQAILEFADDIAIDVPKIWLYLAETVVPIMSSELLSFTAFSKVVQEAKATQLIIEVLQLLVKDKGPSWIRERWDGAQLKWTDFVDPMLVDEFVKNNKLEYTVGAVNASMSATTSTPLTMDQIRQKLVSFLKPEQGSNSSSIDHVCDWISANVGDRVKEPQFIRALMTAICESAIQKHPANSTWKLKENELQRHHTLLLKYVDNKEDVELQCIYAIQALDHALEHPQGLLCSIFQELYDDSMFSTDTFIAWEASKDPAEQAGKGVALKSLTSFYTALKEGDSSCDES